MKYKESKYKIPVDIYGSTVILILTDNIVYSKNKLCKKLSKFDEISEEDNANGWFVFEEDNIGLYYLILTYKTDVYTIVHESTHASLKILEDHDVQYQGDNDETIAYLNGYLAEQIDLKLKRIRKV